MRRGVPAPKAVAAAPPAARLPFEGLRIADFTAFWAGPIVGHFFAMLGAEVIHIESPRSPDGMRGHSLRGVDEEQWWEYTPVFHGPNTNKLGATIDMGTEEGRGLARKLIAECDVVIENFSPRVIEHWGLDYDALKAIRSDIILLRMPAFGLSGPWRDRTGYAQTMEQASGLAWMTGYPERRSAGAERDVRPAQPARTPPRRCCSPSSTVAARARAAASRCRWSPAP